MLTIGFVLTPGFPLMSLAPLSVFEFANYVAEETIYDVTLLSEHGGPIEAANGASVNSKAIGLGFFDTIIIGGNTRVLPSSPDLIRFVATANSVSRRMCSICTGAFLMADAGLLENRKVTTHWLFSDEFRDRYPQTHLKADRIFVVDGQFWTAAGNSAGIDLALHMVENDFGSELAEKVAKILVIEYRRAGGQPQQSALLRLGPKSDRIQKAIAYARKNLRSGLSVDDLAQAARLSKRQFSRAFREETGQTPAKAIEALRLEAARLMIEQSRHPIEAIAMETGFGDPERMRRAFVRCYGDSPHAVRLQAKAGTKEPSRRIYQWEEN